jgi:acyl carrier protein
MREPSALCNADIRSKIRTLVAQHARVSPGATSTDTADLYDAGLTSMASVNLMLALEEHFEIEFPESMLQRKTFSSVAAISDAVQALRSETSLGARP